MPSASRVRRMLATAVAVVGFGAMALPGTGVAHDTAHCYHGDIPNGGWYTQYRYHYWTGSNAHYNVYYHYLYGYYEHAEYNRCN